MIRPALALALAATAAGAQTIDGANFGAEYGPAQWSQNVGTQFGNSTDAGAFASNGSEINAVYARISGGILFVGVAGNLETNFNKLNIALDFRAGGQNTFSDAGNLGNINGLTFDAGFNADVLMSYTSGNSSATGFDHFLDAVDIGNGDGSFIGGGSLAMNNPLSAMLGGAAVAFNANHSNTGGVANLGDPFTSDPSLVDTGVEFSIDIASLGWDGTSEILLAGWINGGGNDFLSNQVIGGLPDGTGNLGGPSTVNFANIDGDQFIRIIPAPGSIALLGLSGLAAIRRRR
jgi:hypothetical protein